MNTTGSLVISAVIIPDIPLLHTAIAQWVSCLLYIFLLKKRFHLIKIIIISIIIFPLFIVANNIRGIVPIQFWLPCMMLSMALIFLFILGGSDVSLNGAGYIWARAFISAEFAASLEWQIFYHLFYQNYSGSAVLPIIVMLSVFTLIFPLIGFFEYRNIPGKNRLDVRYSEAGNSLITAFSVFMISNVNFAFKDTQFTSSLGAGILTVRTLVDFCGLTLLYAQQKQRRESQLKFELDAINFILTRQNDYYVQTRESIEIIKRQYHDLKHQIAVIRQENDPQKRESYLIEMDHAIGVYEAQVNTGNKVLDTVLTGKSLLCMEKKINITCVADGKQLDFINAMDLCSIIGNALDNAIENVERMEQDKRLIRVAVFIQNCFIMIRVENYCESNLIFEEGLPKSTKKDKTSHGFGIKSIKNAAEKYGGKLTINMEDNWFIIRVLIPLPE